MKKKILKLSAICALGMSMSLSAGETFESFKNTALENSFLQVTAGAINFKKLDKKRGFIDLKFAKSLDFELNQNVDITNLIEIKLSQPYKDISFSNIFTAQESLKLDNSYLAVGTRVGYLQHDSEKESHSIDVHAPISVEKITQKAPYIALDAIAGIVLENGVVLSSLATYKVALDRADMRDAYGVEAGISYNNWHLFTGYEKFDFRGVDNQENVSLRAGYTFIF